MKGSYDSDHGMIQLQKYHLEAQKTYLVGEMKSQGDDDQIRG
jgi:hypothetical protein